MIPKFLALVLVLVTTASCSHFKSQKNISSDMFFGNQKVHRYELKNGLKVLILEDHSSATFAYQTWFKVGSKDEEKGLTGLAHLFEHMMFKGTKNMPEGEFDRQLESAGAEGENAFTSQDYTGYVQSMPADKLELIVRLESDRMVNLVVSDESLNKEREVVQNERRFRNENSPDGKLFEKLYDLSYAKHSYHWPVIGYEADLIAAKARQCEAFYKRFYAPNNATVVIVGDINPDHAISLIENYYGVLKSSKIERRKIEIEPQKTAPIVETMKLRTAVEKLMMGYHTVPMDHPDFAALEVLKAVLSTGKTSILYKQLVDKGLASDLGVENEEKEHPALFVIMVNMQKGKKAVLASNVIQKELSKIAMGKISQKEIARAVSLYKLALFDGLVSPSNRAHFLGFYETVGKNFKRGVDIANEVSKVTAKDLAKVAKKYFSKNNRTEVIGIGG